MEAMADEVEDEGNNKPMVHFEDGVWWYRASALGQCTTAMIAVRSGFTALAPPKKMQDRFNEGHLHEPDIVRRANTEFGLEVFARNPATNAQWEIEVPITATVGIKGHTDGKVLGSLPDEDYPLDRFRVFEAKTMSQAAFNDWLKMSWEQRWAKFNGGYAKQMSTYLYGMSLLDGVEYTDWVYAVKNKESGQVIMQPGSGYPYPISSIKTEILAIEAHVRSGAPMPDTCPVKTWPCPVFYVGPCGEDAHRDQIDEREAEIVTALGITLKTAKAAEAVAKAASDEARDAIKKHLPDGGKYDAADGWKVAFTKKALTGTTEVDEFDMAVFEIDHPELVAEYTRKRKVEKWSTERLTVTPPKEWTP